MKTRELVHEFITSRRAKGDAKATITWYEALLGKYTWYCKELPERPQPIEQFLGILQVGDETRHCFYRALRCFYRWTAARHKIQNPMHLVAAPRRHKKALNYLSAAELSILIALPMADRERALVELLVDTGVRIGEALGLCREDIQDEYILVNGKTGQREVPVSREVKDQLLALVRSGRLFQGAKGPLGYTGAYHIVRKALKRTGVRSTKWGPHVLRHTFGRQYVLAGGDLVSLQRILGHSSIKTTQIYADMDLRDITRQHAKFSPLKTALAGAQALLWARGDSKMSELPSAA